MIELTTKTIYDRALEPLTSLLRPLRDRLRSLSRNTPRQTYPTANRRA